MELQKYHMYWNYYQSVEKMLKETNQFVAHTIENGSTFSDEFAKIILLSGSEIDSILKVLCNLLEIKPKDNNYTMKEYSKVLEKIDNIKEIEYMIDYSSSLDSYGISIYPFANFNKNIKHSGLEWWEDYQAIKHDRVSATKKCTLLNALKIVSAHLTMVKLLIDNIPGFCGISYLQEHTKSEYLRAIHDPFKSIIEH